VARRLCVWGGQLRLSGAVKSDSCQVLVAHPIVPATQEAEIRSITVRSQPGQVVYETLSQKTHHKKRAGGAAQGVDPEFKPQYQKKKKKEILPPLSLTWELTSMARGVGLAWPGCVLPPPPAPGSAVGAARMRPPSWLPEPIMLTSASACGSCSVCQRSPIIFR
jgi:hypothetical protein